jgi:hypothetical protein
MSVLQDNKPDSTMQALELAQRLAKNEIDSIERLHKRTLTYISWVLGIGTVFLALLGIVGFSNLKGMAVAVAERNLKKEVTLQVQQKLKKEDINAIVKEETASFAANELTAAVRHQIESGPLHQEILAQASAQSRELIAKSFGQRHLSEADDKLLVSAINREPLLRDRPVFIYSSEFNTEPYRYQKEVRTAIAKSHIKALRGEDADGIWRVEVEDGVVVLYEESQNPDIAEALNRALKAAHIDSRIEPVKFEPFNRDAKREPSYLIELFIGPRPLPKTD